MTAMLSATDVVALLDLEPHPEGGYYRETFRDELKVAADRAASTAIYFLLAERQSSRWHRLDSVELWHWYAGAPLLLQLIDHQGLKQLRLGADFLAGERPQAVVPAHCWQAAETLGAWSLLGCTVAPGFSFAQFELLAPGELPPQAG